MYQHFNILRWELMDHRATAQGVSAPIQIIENIVASHGFAVAEQVLRATQSARLEQEWPIAIATGYKDIIDRNHHPQRRSSLQPRAASSDKAHDPIAFLSYLDAKVATRQRGEDELNHTTVNELEILAGNRADLLLTQRNIVEAVAASKQWTAGMSRLTRDNPEQENVLDHVDLLETRSGAHVATGVPQPDSLRGVMHPSLLHELSSYASFSRMFENLTVSTLKQCVLALRPRLAERLCADVAVLRYDAQDFTNALACLSRAQSTFEKDDWGVIESELVGIHLECLRKLKQAENYARMGLSVLSKDAAHRKLKGAGFYRSISTPSRILLGSPAKFLLQDIFDVSSNLPRAILIPLSEFFEDFRLDPYIQHFTEMDGFGLKVQVRSLFAQSIEAEAIRVLLKSVEAPSRNILLEKSSLTDLRPGMNFIELSAHVSPW
jgi:hypothetical protein